MPEEIWWHCWWHSVNILDYNEREEIPDRLLSWKPTTICRCASSPGMRNLRLFISILWPYVTKREILFAQQATWASDAGRAHSWTRFCDPPSKRWWHPFCLLGGNRWATLAEKYHTKCKYSTLLFSCFAAVLTVLALPLCFKSTHTSLVDDDKNGCGDLISFFFFPPLLTRWEAENECTQIAARWCICSLRNQSRLPYSVCSASSFTLCSCD